MAAWKSGHKAVCKRAAQQTAVDRQMAAQATAERAGAADEPSVEEPPDAELLRRFAAAGRSLEAEYLVAARVEVKAAAAAAEAEPAAEEAEPQQEAGPPQPLLEVDGRAGLALLEGLPPAEAAALKSMKCRGIGEDLRGRFMAAIGRCSGLEWFECDFDEEEYESTCSIGPEGAAAIAKGLPGLTTLKVANNSIGAEGAAAIAKGLPGLTTLDVACNEIGDEGAAAIAKGLPGLTTLNVGFNSIGAEGAAAITEGLPGLTTLNVVRNSIGPKGSTAIATGLPGLTTLNVENNAIGDEGAAAIARGLLGLTTLNVGFNSIGDEGAAALRERVSRGLAVKGLEVQDGRD